MDPAGLISRILDAVERIAKGRKGLDTDGEEHEGRIWYEDGIAKSLAVFQEARSAGDLRSLIVVEIAFLQQEIEFCAEGDAKTANSLTQAVQSFDDALRCLKTVETPDAYRYVEASYSTVSQYRYQGCPRDAVHLAAVAHWTRFQNSLRTPGVNMREKAVLEQRAANMKTIQSIWLAKQRESLGGEMISAKHSAKT